MLDNIPLASVVFVAGLLGGLIALVTGEITFAAFREWFLYLGGGSAAIGYVRNQAGRGTR